VHLRSQHATAVQRVEQAARELDAAKEAEEAAAALVREIPENLPDPAQYETQLAELEQTNAAVRAAKARTEVVSQLDKARGASQSLTDQLAAIDATRAQAMAEAKMPIDGLGFDEDGVTYQDVPFKQASAAEQLRVSVAMAMALNPKVRVIRITDGSLLDSTNLALIEQMAADRDFQVWIERVDETGTVGILIEDGQVAATTEPVPA
jgi:predicted ABC-type transport system involved in lysophospholipase L1 biosynthesis ATPase subunit